VIRTAWVVDLADPQLTEAVSALRSLLAAADGLDLGVPVSVDDLRAADVVVVCVDRPLAPDLATALCDASVRTVLVGSTLTNGDPDGRLSEAAGLLLGPTTPPHDIRVRPGPDAFGTLRSTGHRHARTDHAGVHEHVHDRMVLVDKTFDDVAVLQMARVGLSEQPVLTWRPATATAAWTLGTTPEAVADRTTARTMLATLRMICDTPEKPPVGVGLLGYGAIGHEHRRAVQSVDGLHLVAVCDASEERRAAAKATAPGVVITDSADHLLERGDVDLVVVSTAPNTHADWALRALDAGKHVVVEKPFAIHTTEADDVLATARAAGLLTVVYQNRRYDPDYLAIARLVRSGVLGEVFSIETFVGGYGHPCNLWHSDEAASGGAFYDWGSHVFDQVLDLVPTDIAWVTATSHKRKWFDVTNADHSRTTIQFVDGVEAQFVHSDLAAALKPRWYVLGTAGAIVGHWRIATINSRTEIGTLAEDVLAPADSPPLLELHTPDGSVTQVATPSPEPHRFHRELADRLRFGLPMTVTAQQSRRVLAVMEAARISAEDGGRQVVPR
jgi:scyllo-inositol 2-dehydrogenase (NADP+)